LYQSLHSILKKSDSLKSEYVFFITLGLLNQEIKGLFEKMDNVYTFDFLSQKEIGTLCYICDIAITRAGTTSLAEQKLYDMKLIMVPIPWTHDQYDNAKYYVKKHQDILVDQKNEQFLTNLSLAIRKFKNFKKKLSKKDRGEEISQAKIKIIESILY
jgi:UDP-N-acetylglucosamine:LPS N-acetylglucosamine transferase